MKQKLLLALLALFTLGGSNLFAQGWTDVTDKITNPSFEENDAIADLTSCGWSTDRATGWTILPTSPSNSQVGVGNASSKIQGIASSFNPSAGEKFFYMRENWNPNTEFSASQIISENIPAGYYRLTVKVAMFSSVASTYTLSLQEGSLTAATNSYTYQGTANSESWQEWSVLLVKHADDTPLTIKAAYKTPSENSGGKHYCMLLDDMKLLYTKNEDTYNDYLREQNNLTSAAYNNGIQTNFVVNGTFTDNVNGWTATGGFQNSTRASNQSGDFTVPFWENWNGTAKVNKMYQTINNIPNGTYKLKIAAFVNTLADPNESQYVFANSDKTYLTTGDPTFYEVWTVVTNNTIEIGLEQTTATANWMGIDNVTLTYYGAGDVISQAQAGAHKADWDAALAAAQAAVDNADYANVTGEELDNLNAEIAKTEPTTAEGYDAATAALNAATKAFTEAKPSYDAFVAEKAYAESLGMTVTSESPSSAEKAVLGTNAIKVEEYTYVTENFPQDFSDVYLATPTTNTFDALTAQHWSGESRSYFDFWNGSSADRELTYVITLPAGRYIIKAAGRGQANTASSVTISDGTTTVPFFMKGDTGLGINKAGVASFDPDDAAGFANNNAGRGWEWRYLLMELDEEKEVTLSLKGHVQNSWIGACDFALLTTEDNTSINKAAYKAALDNANAALENTDYVVVTGEERTNLKAEVEKEEPTTASGYDEATAALTTATATFTAAKVSYDALITAKAIAAAEEEEYPYASADKKDEFESAVEAANETVTNAEDAAAKAAALTTAQRTWVESNAMAEGVTDFEVVDFTNNIENARAQQGDQNAVVPGQAWGWTKNVSRKSDEKPTYADGTTLNYLDGGNWNGNSWDIAVTQKIKVPSGKYLLSVTARAATELTTFELIANNETVTLKNLGADVNTGTFGRGYNDGFVMFEVADANDEVTIGVHGVANSAHQWMSFTNFRLVKIAELDPVSITIKAGRQYTAFSTNKALDFTGSELTAQIVTSAMGTSETVTKVPANTGIIVGLAEATTEAKTIQVPVCSGETDDVSANMLVAVLEATTIQQTADGYTNYVFGKSGGKEQFFKVRAAGMEVPANNAYLAISDAEAKGLDVIGFGEDATGINAIKNVDMQNDDVYNLQGQKVNRAQKGVYIVNGKKIVIK